MKRLIISIVSPLICLSILLFSGCSDKSFSKMKKTESGTYDRSVLYPLLKDDGDNVMYNMTLTYKDLSLDGFLVASLEKSDDNKEEIRAVCTAFMGMTLFDFTITDDDFVVNSCMEQLDKKIILHILRKDLVTLFTRNVPKKFKGTKYVEADSTGKRIGYIAKSFTGRTRHIIDNTKQRVHQTKLSGGIFKAQFDYTDESIIIDHPILKLQMTLYK